MMTSILRLGGVAIVVVAGFLAFGEFPGLSERFQFGPDNPSPRPDAAEPRDPAPARQVPPSATGPDRTDPDTPHTLQPDAEVGLEAAATRPDGPDGDGSAVRQPDKTASAGADDGDDAEEPPELSISGAVLDDRGTLLPGVKVEIEAAGPLRSAPSPGDGMTRVTDSLGSFTFEPLGAGEYHVSVEDTEEFHGTGLRVRAGVANAELRVQRIREVRVKGQIIDETGGALKNVRVRDLGGARAPPSDVDGSYEITVEPVKAGLAPVLEFEHPRYRSQRRRVEAIVGSDADAVRLDVEMQPTDEQVAVLGHVSGPRGEPVPDVEVWLSSADPRNYLSTRSNEGGEFMFDQVESGNAYRLGVDPGPDYRRYVSDAFEVGPGNTAHDVRLEDDGYGSLYGRLIDPEGRALSRFTLWLRSRDSGGGHPPIPVTSDGAGNFEVERVPAGTLRLESTSQPRLQAGGIELRPGEARQLEVPLDWGERWMFGTVVDGSGNPVAGARVTLQWSRQHYDVASSSHRRAATDIEGFFTFSNLGARDYSVTVQAPGYQTVRRSYAPGSEDLEITLQSTALAGGSR